MKAFERRVDSRLEDMEEIIKYLKKYGTINVNYAVLESLYEEFSREVYNALWIIVSDHTLSRFADWLEKKEV